jgi:protein-tyrosine phosphatase
MIDLHFHCLPGIDDGPQTWDEAVQLCRAAAADGTTTIVATPHVLRDPWLNEDPLERDRLLVRLNALLGGKPAVVPGCEYSFSSDVVELWEQGSAGPLIGLNRGACLLLEFPSYGVPPAAESLLHELSILNVTPIVAHPERNRELAANPNRLASLVARGALVQITAGSLLGDFDRTSQAAAEAFFAEGLVHLVASDAHSMSRRPPRLAAARRWVARHWGDVAEETLFETNASAVLHGNVVAAPASPRG